jgi:hypothetical protein
LHPTVPLKVRLQSYLRPRLWSACAPGHDEKPRAGSQSLKAASRARLVIGFSCAGQDSDQGRRRQQPHAGDRPQAHQDLAFLRHGFERALDLAHAGLELYK